MTSPELVVAGLREAQISADAAARWRLRPATVVGSGETSFVGQFDGEGFAGTATVDVPMISLVGYVSVGERVMILIVPPAGNYAISRAPAAETSEWISYSPEFTSDGAAQPDVGAGSVIGRWLRVGYRTVTVEVWTTFGAGMTEGLGRYFWSSPFAVPEDAKAATGAAYMFDSGTANRAGIVNLTGGADTYFVTNTPNGNVGAGVPQTWVSGDEIRFSVTHEVSSFDPL